VYIALKGLRTIKLYLLELGIIKVNSEY